MNNILTINNLSKRFDGITALDDFSLSLERGSITGIIGPNGAGKTTLFNVLSGFLDADSGEIHFKDTNILGMPSYKISNFGISRTFQDLRLIMNLTVLDNVLLAVKNQTGENVLSALFCPKKLNKEELENKEKAVSILEHVNLKEKVDDPAGNLSYGQQKLLSLACCLASDAEILMLDEPVAGIHPEIIERMLKIVKELKTNGKTIILIEHNLNAVARVSDRVIVMDEGEKVAEGKHEDVLNDPKVLEAYLE